MVATYTFLCYSYSSCPTFQMLELSKASIFIQHEEWNWLEAVDGEAKCQGSDRLLPPGRSDIGQNLLRGATQL